MTEFDPSKSRRPAILQPTSNLVPPLNEADIQAAIDEGAVSARRVELFLKMCRGS